MSDKSIKNDRLHKSESPGSRLGVRRNRPVEISSQFCLKQKGFLILISLEVAPVLTNMLFERSNDCCNDSHSAARVNADPVQVAWVGGQMSTHLVLFILTQMYIGLVINMEWMACDTFLTMVQ